MKTIGFFGDSFCADNISDSWCNILSQKLGCDHPVCFGEPGRSIWSVFFKFNQLIKQDKIPDILVFCWTEPYRLYHPDLTLSANTQPMDGVNPHIYQTLENYWKYLHSYEKDEMAYEYALRYYDQNILSKVDKKIIQMWSFRPFETAGKDAGIKLNSGVFIDKSMFSFSKLSDDTGTINHMTPEQNQQWADLVYKAYMARY